MSQASVRDPQFQPLARCCSRHNDWRTLAQHVVDTFPDLPVVHIARELRMAKDVVDAFELRDDALEVAELIVRHRLMIATGTAVDAAKLDPQRHDRRFRVAT